MTTSEIAKLILKTLRADVTQGQINEYFGYTFNQAYRWESGKTKISWEDFYKLISLLKVDTSTLNNKYLKVKGDISNGTFLFNELTKNFSNEFIQGSLNLSAAQLLNLRSGRTVVLLEHVLDIVQNLLFLLSNFVLDILDGKKIPEEFKELSSSEIDIQNFTEQYPQSLLLPPLVCTKAYKDLEVHNDELMMKALRVSREEINFLLTKALQFSLLDIEGNKYITKKSVQRHPSNDEQNSIHHYVFDYINEHKNIDNCFFDSNQNIVKMTIANLTTSQKNDLEELTKLHWNKVKEILYSPKQEEIENGDENHVYISTITLHQISSTPQ
ncbi:helix-turn-helix transcriptional regulator [Bacteriovorax sp. Seq25_V]|uniref:helix-turn-helix domain-containing protein n=1 Tax=Bacteriovorax sp. Seq25_V TaxID=1201288 RepID=UPI00038A4134|nr:helix-turn-helix transcriptional regulator [Bacteriovorax sp. Seq25_V]EQC46536.1 hypothetical protein M900_2329 [Bacteriovorax sp. Seq25_V]